MDVLSIIPARGGSVGIHHKNLRLLAGKPLVAYTIENACRSKLINRVVVSTDDTDIASISAQYGAEIVLRPKELSGNTASSESALLHVLESLEKKENYEPDLVVFLQCTSPLTNHEDIDGTIKALLEENADTALSVTPFHHFLWFPDEKNNATGINHDKFKRLPRQKLEPQCLETGSVYVMRTAGFKKSKHRFFG